MLRFDITHCVIFLNSVLILRFCLKKPQSFCISLQIVDDLTAIYSISYEAGCCVVIYDLLKEAASNAECRVTMKR